jgi:hypothetical protein
VPQHGDGQDQQERHERHDVGDPQRLVPALERLLGPAVDERRQRVADEAPLLELGRPLRRDPEHLGRVAADADQQEHAEDHRVFRLGLDPDAVRPLHVPPADGP